MLDVGCGDGALLSGLKKRSRRTGAASSSSQKGVNEAVARGLSVVQGDADHDLATYPDGAFDFVILSQTLQATYNPRIVLEQLLRIGRKVVVSFPNFGNWRVRAQFLLKGRMPITEDLPYSWYDTPNIHFCTVRDFMNCGGDRRQGGEGGGAPRQRPRHERRSALRLWNALADQAIFLLSRR